MPRNATPTDPNSRTEPHTRRISTHATEPAEPLVSSTFRLHTCTPFGVLHKSPQKSASHEPRVAPIETQMLSLWKLRVGAEDYYLEQVAKGLDDYYSGAGETRGEWLGAASTALGLEHAVSAAELRAVLAGLAPGTGLTPNGDQIRTFKNVSPASTSPSQRPNRCQFSTPSPTHSYAHKSPKQPTQPSTKHSDGSNAKRASCGADQTSAPRRHPSSRSGGTRRLPGNGFIAAQFRHRTSRHGDPQLHSHVLIANMTQGPDGKWSALDGQALYRSKIAAGTVYQSVPAQRARLPARGRMGSPTQRSRRHRWRPEEAHPHFLQASHRDRNRNSHAPDKPDRKPLTRRRSIPVTPRSTSNRTPSTGAGTTKPGSPDSVPEPSTRCSPAPTRTRKTSLPTQQTPHSRPTR